MQHGIEMLLFAHGHIEGANVRLEGQLSPIEKMRQRDTSFLVGQRRQAPKMREQEILNIESVDGLKFEIRGRHALKILPESDEHFGNKAHVMLESQAPPKIDIFDVQIESVAAGVDRALHVERDRRMANRRQVSRQHE